MDKNGKKTKDKKVENPYKKEAFEKFIELLRGNAIAHWVQVAAALGIDKDTITEWKRHSMAQKAIRDGIERAMDGMQKAGEGDWRMWESKLKMLGVSPIERSDLTSGGEKLPSPLLGGTSKNGSDNNGDKKTPPTPEANPGN